MSKPMIISAGDEYMLRTENTEKGSR